HVTDTAAMYRSLEDFVRDRFGVQEIAYRWSNEDYDSHDRVPFVGCAESGTEHLWVATGFCSWGFTNGTAAAMVLADAIAGMANPWARLYDSTRTPGKAPNDGSPPMRTEEAAKPRKGAWDQLQPSE